MSLRARDQQGRGCGFLAAVVLVVAHGRDRGRAENNHTSATGGGSRRLVVVVRVVAADARGVGRSRETAAARTLALAGDIALNHEVGAARARDGQHRGSAIHHQVVAGEYEVRSPRALDGGVGPERASELEVV